MHANETYVREALRNGATGYVLKDANPAEMLQAVRKVRAGHRYLSSSLSERAIEAYANQAHETPRICTDAHHSRAGDPPASRRELQHRRDRRPPWNQPSDS